jgi:hypothetical protein
MCANILLFSDADGMEIAARLLIHHDWIEKNEFPLHAIQ